MKASVASAMREHAQDTAERCAGMSQTLSTMLDTIPPGENSKAVDHVYRRALAFTSMIWSN